jgi:hypothetical protein
MLNPGVGNLVKVIKITDYTDRWEINGNGREQYLGRVMKVIKVETHDNKWTCNLEGTRNDRPYGDILWTRSMIQFPAVSEFDKHRKRTLNA